MKNIDSRNIKQTIAKGEITLEAKYLNSNINLSILEACRKKYNNKYINSYGYILEVVKVNEYKNYISNANSSIIFIVKMSVDSINPDIENEIYGKCLITNRGLFSKIHDNIIAFISISSLEKDYDYNENDNSLTSKDDFTKIINNDYIQCKISVSEYSGGTVKYIVKELKKDMTKV
jgi:DNA-directed RNA polymerase subunit E'/Rpb7